MRESTRNGEVTANNVKEEYSKTVQDVENYTDNLSNGANQSQNNDYNTFIYDDTNLDKVPDLEPINVSQDISDNTVDEKVNNSDKKALNKLRKEDKARERTEKENSKYSTKGLIFSHTKADKSAEEQKEVSNSIQTKEVNTTSSKKTEKIDGVELLPLDDIRVPELKKDGYSIYSYYEN